MYRQITELGLNLLFLTYSHYKSFNLALIMSCEKKYIVAAR